MTARLDILLEGFARDVPPFAIRGLALDSRRLRPGEAFLAVRGSRGHGLMHLPEALQGGASAIVWEPAAEVVAPQAPVPCIAVEHLASRVGEIAARYFGRPSDRMFVAGITGTDGKTSTAHLIAQAFEHLGRPCAYLGTLGVGRVQALDETTHTTPDPIALHARLADFCDAGIAHCAIEVSSHALDQNRVGGVRFDAAVLTNVTRDHLDYHGTVERYAQAKRKLFEVEDGRSLLLNRDDPQGARWIEDFAGRAGDCLVVYGLEGPIPAAPSFFIGRGLRLHDSGLDLDIESHAGRARITSRLLGRFNAYNLLAAVAVLIAAGIPLDAACEALSQARTVPGRIEGFRGPRAAPLVVVDYAHTPQALEQVLRALRPHARGRLICVFGCGGDRDRGKRPIMGEIASRLAHRVIVTSDNPRTEPAHQILDDIIVGMGGAGGADRLVIEDRRAAIIAALREAAPGDVVLIAGKGHEPYQDIAGVKHPFSDHAVASEALAKFLPKDSA
ncbi:MAG: UDP-N-acetylmuramoyl-L-alanyl-D-glutamate--2,6-diaminopimelate ligase [Panacagrimonas sp.]